MNPNAADSDRRTVFLMDDGFDDAAQPCCQQCGTVMRDWTGGFKCFHCNIVVLRTAAY